MAYPPSPWDLCGDLFVSLWRVGRAVAGTAFANYRGGSLAYGELMAVRPVLDRQRPAVRITDIWVDSVASRDGGRSLWAIPKKLADLQIAGDVWTASTAGRRIAAATFHRGRRLPGRWPVRLRISQPRSGSTVLTPTRGWASAQLAHADWDLPADGPLAHLADRRPLVSLVLADFEIRVGR
ncbi:MAG TPA: acetoacetate decarboxylase family protein [Nocardioidaceae bacterium]|nr:acetoacetate decarboxylase family protein [Nocardioidaceae bacterium]